MNDTRLTLESRQRLSESLIWHDQRDYYSEQGVNAWAEAVPSFITSNAFMADTYVSMILAFLQDQHSLGQQKPLYIVELGAGSGRLAFYILHKLYPLWQQHPDWPALRYVMTDYAASNIEFWQQHAALQPYVDLGVLQFAELDVEQFDQITLVDGEVLSADSFVNPVIVLANYVFDSVRQDAFEVKAGALNELLLDIKAEKDNVRDGLPINWADIELEFSGQQVAAESYYDDPDFNRLLDLYKQQLNHSSVLFPVSALQFLRQCYRMAKSGFILLSADNGLCDIEDLEGLAHPLLSVHGSVSMLVNFHAMQQYVQMQGGAAVLSSTQTGLKTNAFLSHGDLAQYPQFSVAAKQHLQTFNPADYYNLYRSMTAVEFGLDCAAALSLLKLSDCDPYVLSMLAPVLRDAIATAEYETVHALKQALVQCQQSYYFLPGMPDSLFDIAVLYHAMREYELALQCYLDSQQYFGEHFNVLFNIALCYYQLDNNADANAFMLKAKTLQPESEQVAEWLGRLQQ